MRILLIFDSMLMGCKDNLPFFNKNDTVHLFPLTSKKFITTDLLIKIKGFKCNVKSDIPEKFLQLLNNSTM